MKPSSRNTALVVVLLVVLAVGAAVWMSQRDLRATDDAFVDADIVTVTAEASGLVQAVHVADNAQVTRGAALVDLDSEDLKLQLASAVASQDAANAQQDEVKEAGGARLRAAQAQVRLAQAKTAEAQLALSKAHVTAPTSGYIARRTVSQGDFVRAGQPLLAIVSQTSWVTANLKETQLQGVKPGDEADVTIDAYPDLTLKAHVDSIQPGAGQAFSLLPPENASGNFVKLVQRVPVKLVFDTPPGRPLAPGLSARLTIHVR